MYSNFAELKEVYCEERFGELWQAYSLKSKLMLLYWGSEYIRKMILALVVVFI